MVLLGFKAKTVLAKQSCKKSKQKYTDYIEKRVFMIKQKYTDYTEITMYGHFST